MSGLVEFLLARIAEDEASASPRASELNGGVDLSCGSSRVTYIPPGSAPRWDDRDGTWGTQRVLRECAAKRQIIEQGPSECSAHGEPPPPGFDRVKHYPEEDYAGHCDGCASAESADAVWCASLRALALAYSDHPDFHGEWRP